MIDVKMETLISLAETLSYTKTAEKLSLTQPAVSTHIKNLEKEFGVIIFKRTNREMKITPEGEIILKYAKRLKTLSIGIKQSLLDFQNNQYHLVIGITPTAEENIIPIIFAKYCNANPNIHIKVITDSIKNIYNRLKTFEIDLAIVEGKITGTKFHSILLDTDYLCLAVSNDNPLAQKRSVSLQELKKENFILRSSSAGTRKLFESHLISQSESIDDYNIIMEIDNVTIIKELVASNFGVTIIAKSACVQEMRNHLFTLIPIENMSMIREINMIYYQDFSNQQLLNDVIRIYNETKLEIKTK